jgi:hypothetical protein
VLLPMCGGDINDKPFGSMGLQAVKVVTAHHGSNIATTCRGLTFCCRDCRPLVWLGGVVFCIPLDGGSLSPVSLTLTILGV